ncbi:zinc finger BED domain-containing protein RICESLEEPER 2-like [Rhizophagus irregularis DAOM 181602=DAOM 197198]|nr:zinc finger BED domain-containing protein RICESLEEPER 2-like [Rhizophagus irregularis DAOM 181602=DAOM 197198]
MSNSFNSLNDAFIPNIDDIDNIDNKIEEPEPSRKTASVWNYVNCKDLSHPGVPVCKTCGYVFSIKSGNSSIERHLLSKHCIVIQKVRKQTTLKFKCKDPWPEKEKLERDDAVVTWIIADQQPFSFVEKENFIKMMNVFDSRYKVPDCHQIKEKVVQEFNKRHLNIRYDLLKIPGRVSFTADMWTSTLSSEAYLGLTIHYVDENWTLWRFLLDIIPFKTRHTGINMATAINNVLCEFNLAGKALALTTDNESAMLVCAKQGMEIIDEKILNVRKLMIKIKNSVLLCDDLCELCSMEKIEYLRPEVDIETRWNSTYYMLCKFQRMETALKMLAIKHENIFRITVKIRAPESYLMKYHMNRGGREETIIVLEPLERATKNLSGSKYPTIADVRFYFNEIWDHLKYCMESDQYLLADSINQKIEEYWTILDDATMIATILDPRNKITLFELGESTTKAINTLKERFSFYYSKVLRSRTSIPKENNNVSGREYFYQLKKRRLGETTETAQASTRLQTILISQK